MISNAQEFQQLKVRDDELEELDDIKVNCELPVKGGSENVHGKVSKKIVFCDKVEKIDKKLDKKS